MNRTYQEIRHDHHADQGDFEFFRGDKQKVRERTSVWSTDAVLEKYVSETDQLIGIIDGSITAGDGLEVRDASVEADDPIHPDTVIWLDKSARPVSWLVDALWDQMAKHDAKKPQNEFLNIDRVNWFVHTGYDQSVAKWRLGPEDFDITKVDPERIAALRAFFVDADLDEATWQQDVWDMPTKLDGQSILIVDEVKNRGGTLAIAAQLIKAAIPDATVNATYFWHTARYSVNKTSAEAVDQQMESAPVWYDNDLKTGRGVGDISIGYYEQKYNKEPTQENLKRKLASFALSAPHHDPETFEERGDVRADKMRQDIAYISYALAEGKIIRNPSRLRDDDEAFAIYQAQGLTPDEVKNYNRSR